MLKVPEVDVRNNPSLTEIDRQPGANFPYYKDKKAVLPVLDGHGKPLKADTPGNPIGKKSELPEVEDDCQPAAGPNPTYLSWSTLHEVAHGVDDKNGVMSGMGGNAFAGWQELTVSQVAAVAAKKFNYDAGNIETLLKGGKLLLSTPPKEVAEWCTAVRMRKNGDGLWSFGSECTKRAIDGRVYHESYPGKWVSYNLDARKKGITGYQFRAGGEWYAELYAAFYTGKLKPSHPYIGFIQQVDAKTKGK
jgi:hypothetical protein